MNTVPQVQGSQEWLDFRKTHIGASDAATIMGVNPYSTAYDLYMQKKGLAPEQFKSAAMQRGNDLEPEARAWYEQAQGVRIRPVVMVSDIYEWMHASFDGMSFEGDIGVEIKCPGVNTLKQIATYGIPEHYFCQCQHQMFVAGIEQIDLVIFDGIRGKIYAIPRDEKYIFKLLDKEIEFFECLKNNTPPLQTKGKTQYESNDSDEFNTVAEAYRASSARLKIEEEINEGLRERFKELCAGKNMQGNGVSVSFVTQKGSVDYAKIPQLKEVDLEQYRKKEIVKMTIKVEN